MRRRVMCLVGLVLAATFLVQAAGTVFTQSFTSAALGEERTMLVYLPEGYDTSGLSYPVVYFLHGADGGVDSWYFPSLQPALDELIASGLIDPVIVVEPDSVRCDPPPEWQARGFTDKVFHLHTNSALLGNQEDYLVQDVVGWVDANYRTLADRENRSLLGRSMGGHGAIRLVLRHPEVFSAASIDAGFMANLPYLELYIPVVLLTTSGPPYEYDPSDGFYSAQLFSYSAAVAPNLDNPPWYVDFLLDENGEIVEEVRQRLVEHSPMSLIADFVGSEQKIDLFFRIGDHDEYEIAFWPVIDALEAAGLPHELRIFEGGHFTPLAERLPIHLTYLQPIKASLEISPRMADTRMRPGALQVTLELPGALDVNDIDCESLELVEINGSALDCQISCYGSCEISDLNGNGTKDLSLWLPCSAVAKAAWAAGGRVGDEVSLTVRGELSDGRFFSASDSVTLGGDPNAVSALD